jgi:hypothetical protein
MQMTIWTLSTDDNCGTRTEVFTTEKAAWEAWADNACSGFDAARAATQTKIDAGQFPLYLDDIEGVDHDPIDTYSIESHTIEVPNPHGLPPEVAERFITAAREDFAAPSNNELEIDDAPLLSVGDEGVFVAAWVYIGNERAGLCRDCRTPVISSEDWDGLCLACAEKEAAGSRK